MHRFLRRIVPLLTSAVMFFASAVFPAALPPSDALADFSVLTYPQQAVKTLDELGLTADALTKRDDYSLPEYVQSCGYDDANGVFVSPFYTAKLAQKEIPVYAAMVTIRKTKTGGLHSFAEVYTDTGKDFCWTLELTANGFPMRSAAVLPQSLGVSAAVKHNTVFCSITSPGIYTVVVNGAQQEYGFTLFVRERVDDDAQIRAYQTQYGEENVTVYDRGVHEFDYLHMQDVRNKVVYLREGAYLIAQHHYSIRSAEDEELYIEPEAVKGNSVCLTRFPFMNFYRSENLVVAGHGVLDLTRLDRRERRGLVFTHCENVQVSGIKIVNAPEWSFITYRCRNLTVRDVDIFGYRGNADGFAVCNTKDARISGCFARTADDLFEVKTLGCDMGSDNILYEQCVGWGGYARCFGITGEVCRPITNVTFRDSAVIYRDATWDDDRIGSLVVIAEQTDGSIDGVTFENMEVFRDEGRPINVKVYDDQADHFTMRSIVYRNIHCVSYKPAQVASNEKDGNTVSVTFDHVCANGFDLSNRLLRRLLLKTDDACELYFS